MGAIGEYLFYAAVRVVWWGGSLIPLRWLRPFLMRAALLSDRLGLRPAARVRANIRLAFPDWSDARVEEHARKASTYWVRLAAEIIHARELADASAQTSLGELHRAVDDQLARGRGLLILTAHFGNFELLGRMCARRNVPLATFFRPFRNRYFNRFFVEHRRSMNLRVLGRGAEVRHAMRLLGNGGMVAVLLDQNQRPGRGIFVEMFGRPASTSTALARLSLASGAPVLPVFALWRGDEMVPLVCDVVEPEGPGSPAHGFADRAGKVRALTARYTSVIESVVRRHPEQWNWVHRRWKTQPASSKAQDPSPSRKVATA